MELVKSPKLLEYEAWKAAEYAGQAGAMATNLYTAGDKERAAIWAAEQNAWIERQNAAIAAVPLGRQAVADRATLINKASYEDNVIHLTSEPEHLQSAQAA